MRQPAIENHIRRPVLLRRPRSLLALLIVLHCGLCTAQSPAPAPQLSDFSGTWNATFRDKVWLILKLTGTGKSVSGTLTHALQVVADDNGEVAAVSEEMTDESKITRADLEDGVLSIRAEDSEGLSDNYEMKLTGPETAELRSVGSDEDSDYARKPVKLKRAVSLPRPQSK